MATAAFCPILAPPTTPVPVFCVAVEVCVSVTVVESADVYSLNSSWPTVDDTTSLNSTRNQAFVGMVFVDVMIVVLLVFCPRIFPELLIANEPRNPLVGPTI